MKWILMLICFLLPQGALWAQPSRTFSEQCVQRYAKRYHIEPDVIAAFIDVESGWNPHAVSPKGAVGLMQLMPATAKRFGAFDPFNPEQNIAAGTRYITVLMWEFQGDLRLVAAAYNAGDKWVGKRLLNYRNPVVIAYVESVRKRYSVRHTATLHRQRR